MIKSSTVIMFCCILFVSKVSTTKLLPLLRNSRIISTGKVPLQRLERIINNRGAGSRTEITKLLRQGRIKVNGKTVRGTGQYLPNVEITVDNEILPEIPLLAKYYKPVGIVCSMGDPWGRPNLHSVVEAYPFLQQMHPVGRLDCDTSGLLLFSSNGKLTKNLLHPSSNVRRIYEAVVGGVPIANPQQLKNTLSQGVATTDGTFSAELLEAFALPTLSDNMVRKHNMSIANRQALLQDRQYSANNPLIPPYSEQSETNDTTISDTAAAITPTSCIRLAVTEGKYRMVRRILHNVGHSVLHLHRLAYGSVTLEEAPDSECAQNILLPTTDITDKKSPSTSTTQCISIVQTGISPSEVVACTPEEIKWAQQYLGK